MPHPQSTCVGNGRQKFGPLDLWARTAKAILFLTGDLYSGRKKLILVKSIPFVFSKKKKKLTNKNYYRFFSKKNSPSSIAVPDSRRPPGLVPPLVRLRLPLSLPSRITRPEPVLPDRAAARIPRAERPSARRLRALLLDQGAPELVGSALRCWTGVRRFIRTSDLSIRCGKGPPRAWIG